VRSLIPLRIPTVAQRCKVERLTGRPLRPTNHGGGLDKGKTCSDEGSTTLSHPMLIEQDCHQHGRY
jgi:hypothetical protein